MSTPQSCIVIGLFSLCGGERIPMTNKSTQKSSSYLFYNSVIMGRDSTNSFLTYRCRVSMWSPDNILPDDTVVFLVGRVAFSHNERIAHINTLFHVPFPGDPTSPDYENNIPDFNPWFFAIGILPHKSDFIQGTEIQGFDLKCSEYIRNETVPFIIHCQYDLNHNRWKNAPAIFAGSCVQVIGTFSHLHTDGSFGIGIQHVTLNLGSAPKSNTNSIDASPSTASPKRRKRFLSSIESDAPPASGPSSANQVAVSTSTATSSSQLSSSPLNPSAPSQLYPPATQYSSTSPSNHFDMSFTPQDNNVASDPAAVSSPRIRIQRRSVVESNALPPLPSLSHPAPQVQPAQSASGGRSLRIAEPTSANMSAIAKGKRRAPDYCHPDFLE